MAAFGWRVPDFPVDGSENAAFQSQTIENLEAATQSGYASAWVADHFVPWAQWQDKHTPSVECWTTLTHLAALYPQLTWGTIVLCQSYRNPALLAKMAANFCALHPGKFVFGIGAGWKVDEYEAYNIPFPPAGQRLGEMADTVRIARQLWTETDATYEGRYYSIHNATVNPKPDPLPPVMIGGGGEKLTLRLTAELADWWNLPGGTLENYKHKLEILRGHCEAVGRDYNSIQKTWACECVAVADSQEEAEQVAQRSPFYSPDSAIVGTPDRVAEQISAWVGADVQHFQLRFADFPRTNCMERFAREVLPRFTS